MNAVSRQPERDERAEREELARLLPAAAGTGLHPDRHRLLKGHVMNEIDFGTQATTGAARRSRRRLVLILAPAAACSLALAAALGGLDGLTGGGGTGVPRSVATAPVASPAGTCGSERVSVVPVSPASASPPRSRPTTSCSPTTTSSRTTPT